MRTALVSFENEIEKLQRFLDTSEAEEEILAEVAGLAEAAVPELQESLETVKRNRTIKRRQDYVSSIIVLYGALERYVEELIGEYTQSLMGIYHDYNNLPARLRERHSRLMIDYLGLVKDGRVRQTEGVVEIVETLHACLSGAGKARLNPRAFSMRSANTNWVRIRETMKNVDVELNERRVLTTPAYGRYLSDMHGIGISDTNESEVAASVEHIDELVSLRNDFAHGVADVSAIENVEIVRERAGKLGTFAVALNEILYGELLEARLGLNQLVRVEGEVQVFGGNVACFAWPSGRLAVGDMLVMKPADMKAGLRYGPISSIEIDGESYDDVKGADGRMVGVKVPFRVKKNGEFHVWSGED